MEAEPNHIEGRPWPSDRWRTESGWRFPEIADDDGFFWVTTHQVVARERGFALRPHARVCFTRDVPASLPPADLFQIVDDQGAAQPITQLTVDPQRRCVGFSAAQPLVPEAIYGVVVRRIEGDWLVSLRDDAVPSDASWAQTLAEDDAVILVEPFTVQRLGDAVAERLALLPDGQAWGGRVPEAQVLFGEPVERLAEGNAFGIEQGRRGFYVRLHVADYQVPEEGSLTLAGEQILDLNRTATTTAVVLKSVESGAVRFGLINGDWSVSAQIDAVAGTTVRAFQEIFVPLESFPEIRGFEEPAFSKVVVGQIPLPVWRGPRGLLSTLPEDQQAPHGVQDVQVTVWFPRGPVPDSGWPLTVLGAGYGGMRHDMWIFAHALALEGHASIALDPVGHGGGPGTELQFLVGDDSPYDVPSPGRSVDTNLDDRFGLTEGMQASWAPPDFAGMTWLHDANRQIVLDLSALLTVVLPDDERQRAGSDFDQDGRADFDPASVAYVGHSNGGRYGMLFAAHEKRLKRAVLMAPPGDGYVPYISSFRASWAALFDTWTPPLTASSSTRYGLFEEGIVWPGGPNLVAPPFFQGINRYTARRAWLAGDAEGEGAAHLWRLQRDQGALRADVSIQLITGDPAVVNPDSMRMVDAAGPDAVLSVVDPGATAWRAMMRYSDLFYRHLIPTFLGQMGYAPADLARLMRAQMVAFIQGEPEADVDGEGAAILLEPDRQSLRFILGFDFWELRQLLRF
jgi:dienelactone hydrolase